MEIPVEQTGEVAIALLPGDHLDAGVVEEFRRDITPILDAHPKIAFDMSQLRFVDSAGVGALLSCLRRVSGAGGDLKIFGLSAPVRAVFNMARMHRIFDIYETRDEALKAFESAP